MWKQLSIPCLLSEGRKTAKLAIPLVIGQVSQMLMMIADTVMVGKVGITELAALTFANAFFSVPFIFGVGLITSISVLSSSAAGKKDEAEAQTICRNGFYLALGASALLFLLSCCLLPFLSLFRQPPEVTAMTPHYLLTILISLIPALGSLALKNHVDSLGHPWPAFFIFLGGVFFNIFLNQLLIFNLKLGLEGAGYATLIARVTILFIMLVWLMKSKKLSAFIPPRWIKKPDFIILRRLLVLGVPASLHLLAEVGAFSASGLLVGLYGEVSLAAHQIALTTAGTFFMIPLGLAIAITMRIGNVAGAQEKARYPALIFSGWLLTLMIVITTGLICIFCGRFIADLYVDEMEVIKLAAQFLVIVGIFQLVDGIQVVSSGILRGLKDVKIPAWTAFVSYWIFGIPVGWILATYGGLGAPGIWWGLAIGLTIAAVFLSARVFKIAR